MRWDALVEVSLLPGIADPAGTTIERSLPTLGFEHVSHVRMGKAIRLVVDADHETAARATVEDLCRRFLTNPVIERATISISLAGQADDPDVEPLDADHPGPGRSR